MKYNNVLLSLMFGFIASVGLSACGGGGGETSSGGSTIETSGDVTGTNNVDENQDESQLAEEADTVTDDIVCTEAEPITGLTGIWKLDWFTKWYLGEIIGTIDELAGFNSFKLINVGILMLDKGESVSLAFCETNGFSELERSGDKLEALGSFNELTDGLDVVSGITVKSNSSVVVDVNVPDVGSVAFAFNKASLGSNHVCMSFEGMPPLPRTKITCIDQPLFAASDGEASEITELTMGVISGGDIYRIMMDLGSTIQVGVFDVAAENVSITIGSAALTPTFGVSALEFGSGTINIIEKNNTHIKGELDLISTGGQRVRMAFYSKIY